MSGDGPAQLPLELPLAPRLGREDFLAAPANAAALALVENWPDWPARIVMLIGPPGSGKTHLLSIFAARSGALRVAASDLPSLGDLVAAAPRAVAIDDLDALADETALFHLLNHAVESGAFVLMAASRPPTAGTVRLPDLLSRFRRAPVIEIGAPDDALMRAVLEKLFRDRQLVVEPPALAYAALRLERSLDAARAFVAALDREALARRRPVTRALAARVLAAFDGGAGAEPGEE
jgi:chromosomal replication initiation ATPase DnaA